MTAPYVAWRGADLLARDPRPYPWLIDRLIPRYGLTELFGPPAARKSHVLGSILGSLASNAPTWCGLPIDTTGLADGDVWWISDEIPADDHGDEASRLLHRVIPADLGPPYRLIIEPAQGQAIAQVREVRTQIPIQRGYISGVNYQLDWTRYGARLWRLWCQTPPRAIAIDSATALIRGITQPSQEMAIVAATTLDRIARQLGCPVIQTAHTSQDSHLNWSLSARLTYSARTGTIGIPAGYSAMLGVTRWRAGECAEATRALRLDPGQRTIICVAQAKIRGAPEWRDPCHPVVLEQGGDGSLRMVCDRADLRRDDGRQHSSGNKRRKRNDAI